MNSIKNNDYIDLLDIVKRIWVYKLPIIALAVFFAVLSIVRVGFFVDNQYVSSGMLYVSNQSDKVDEQSEINITDINTAKSMSATYREILKTRTFLAEVSESIGGRFSWKQIQNMISISAVNNTELLQISVTATTPQDAYLVADSMIKNAPMKLSSVFKNGQVAIVDDAIVPSAPVSKGTMGEAAKGFIVGMFIGLAIVVVIGLFDSKVRKSEDVSKRYDVSILGEISQ